MAGTGTQSSASPPARNGCTSMDLGDFICARGICPGVVGNVYVYKDDNHPTRTDVESMIPMFEERLLAATRWS